MIPLPRKTDPPTLGESRSQAVKRFITLERSLQYKGRVQDFNEATEYMESGHAEEVPTEDLSKSRGEVFYLPMHIVYKESSSTTKVCVVFDASAKSSTGVSLNDLLLVGPTVHSTLMDVLLQFRLYRVALIADVSRMYRAVQLSEADKDLHAQVCLERRHWEAITRFPDDSCDIWGIGITFCSEYGCQAERQRSSYSIPSCCRSCCQVLLCG